MRRFGQWVRRMPAIFLLVLVASPSWGLPLISEVSGTYSHGYTITVTGTGFGTKSQAAPEWWDDGESAVADSPGYIARDDLYGPPSSDNLYPSRGGPAVEGMPVDYLMQYHATGFRNTTPPHSRSTKYIAGGHYDDGTCSPASSWPGGNVYLNPPAFSNSTETVYATWYERLDPLWPYNNDYDGTSTISDSSGDNFKWFTLEGARLYEADYGTYGHMYINAVNDATPHHHLGYIREAPAIPEGSCGWESNPSAQTGGTRLRVDNPADGWVRREVIAYKGWTPGSGWLKIYVNGEVAWEPCAPNTSTPIANPGCAWAENDNSRWPDGARINAVTIGGFWRDAECSYLGASTGDEDAFRYWDDIYVDRELNRVMLGNNANWDLATIREPQIPVSWGGGSITFSANLGRFPNAGVAYLFVFDGDNIRNPVGYPISINGSVHGDSTPPEAPVLERVVPNEE